MTETKQKRRRPIKTRPLLLNCERKYRYLCEDGSAVMLMLGADGKVMDANNALLKISGYSRDEIVGKNAIDFVVPEQRQKTAAQIQMALSKGAAPQFELTIRSKDGSTRTLLLPPTQLVLEEGQRSFLVMGVDITERKHAEETLSSLAAIVESSNDAIIGKTLDGIITSWNRGAENLYGYSSEEAKGKPLSILIPPNRPDEMAKILDSLRRGEPVQHYETRRVRKDGTVIDVSLAVSPIQDSNGIVGASTIARDITERKHMLKALQESEEKYRALLENSPSLIGIFQDGVLKYVNRAVITKLGWTFEELVSPSFDPIEKVVSQKSRSVIKENVGKRLRDEDHAPYEIILTRKDGSEVPVLVRGANIIYHQKPAIEFVFDDVTELKRLEEELEQYSLHLEELVSDRTMELRKSEEKYRGLFDACPVSLWEEDFSLVKQFLDELRQKGIQDFEAYFATHPKDLVKCAGLVKVLNINKATLSLYGAKSVDEIIGGLSRVFTEESNRGFVREVVALVEGRKYYEAEFENRTLQGETKHCNVICTVVPGYEESLARVLVCIVDLTPQKQLDEELRASRERLEYVVASNPAVLFLEKPLPDRSNTFSTFVSESATSILGFKPKNFLGESGADFWKSRVHRDDLARYLAEMPSLWSDGHHSFEFRFLHSDGVYRWIREEMKVTRDAEGRILDVVGVGIDVTERMMLYEKLAKTERLAAIGETAAMVGHDLRNPLQGIAGALNLLKQESLTTEERNEMLQVIEKCVHYSDAIINDLLEYSGDIKLKLAEATPKSITREAIGAVKVPQNVMVQDLSEDQPTLRVDPDSMRRVVINLIENAIDAMPQGGTLTISSRKSDGNAEITLADTGSGISEEVMENLWKPLQTTKAKGMGLGLAICKRIIDAHGGNISVKSKTGEGTAMTIRLPIKLDAVQMKRK